MFWIPGHTGVRGNEIDDELARKGPVHQFAGLQPANWVSRQNIRKKDKTLEWQSAYGNMVGVLPVLRDKL